MEQLRLVAGIEHVRGRGLMIGFDVPEHLKDLKKNLLTKHHIFAGEAKPNVIRLLPPLNLDRHTIDHFIDCLKTEIKSLTA
jgi:acetylornithine/N-succinyldiaminopimelate aminotransferase